MFGTTYLQKWKTIELEIPLIINELKDAFFSFEINKSHGQDGISFNGIKDCFVPLSTPLLNIFSFWTSQNIYLFRKCSSANFPSHLVAQVAKFFF